MGNSATLSFSRNGRGLFSTDEVRELMHVEFERARRYGFAVTCLNIQVDRIENIETVHGLELKEDILHSVAELVKGATRAGDMLGYRLQDRMIVLVPHTGRDAARFLAERLLRGARSMRFEQQGRTIRITLSIGLAHNQHQDATSFESLEAVAAEGRDVADHAGGDRVVETELYKLHQPKPESVGYRGRLEELVADSGDLEAAVAQITEEIVERAMREAREDWMREAATQSTPAPAEEKESESDAEAALYKKQVEMLQRRLAKLTESLGVTERELARVRRLKAVDAGIESIYTEVQGVDDGEDQAELKKELMSKIFAANLDLKEKRSA